MDRERRGYMNKNFGKDDDGFRKNKRWSMPSRFSMLGTSKKKSTEGNGSKNSKEAQKRASTGNAASKKKGDNGNCSLM